MWSKIHPVSNVSCLGGGPSTCGPRDLCDLRSFQRWGPNQAALKPRKNPASKEKDVVCGLRSETKKRSSPSASELQKMLKKMRLFQFGSCSLA